MYSSMRSLKILAPVPVVVYNYLDTRQTVKLALAPAPRPVEGGGGAVEWTALFSIYTQKAEHYQAVLQTALSKLPVALPFALATIVGGIDCTESAAAAGDEYDTRTILLTEGVTSVAAALLGGVLQTDARAAERDLAAGVGLGPDCVTRRERRVHRRRRPTVLVMRMERDRALGKGQPPDTRRGFRLGLSEAWLGDGCGGECNS